MCFLVLQSKINTVSAAEVTSCDIWCSVTQESSSAFRRLGCARLCPVSTLLGSAWPSNSDNLCHTAVQPQRHDHQLLQKTVEREEADEGFAPPYTTENERQRTAASGFDRVANVSVHFPCSPSAAELARKLQAAQRNKRQIPTTNVISFAPHHSSPDNSDQVTSFNVLPDSVVVRVFSSGLDSYELCRCGLVCRRWNALVWNDSRLWTTIDFGFHGALDVDEALRTLTRALSRTTPRLCLGVEKVVLRGCQRLTDDGLRTIARRCIDLRRLDVSWCTLITNTALFDVLSRCANLQHLDITGLYLSVVYISYVFLCVRAYLEHKRTVDLHSSRRRPPTIFQHCTSFSRNLI